MKNPMIENNKIHSARGLFVGIYTNKEKNGIIKPYKPTFLSRQLRVKTNNKL